MAPKQSLGVNSPEVIIGHQQCTAFDILRIGNVIDNAATYQSAGVPLNVVPTEIKLQAPPAADVDYYVASGIYNTVGALMTLVNSTLATNDAAGEPFCRNVIVDPDASTSGSILFTVEDANGQVVERTVTFSASSTPILTAWTCRRIISAEILVGFGAAVNVEVGFDDIFGLKYPAYMNTIIAAGYDAGGDDYPSTDTTNFAQGTDWIFVGGLPDSATADHYGTISLAAADTDPDGTADYSFIYLAQNIYLMNYAARTAPSYPNDGWNAI